MTKGMTPGSQGASVENPSETVCCLLLCSLVFGPCHLRGTHPNSARSQRQLRAPQSPHGVSRGPITLDEDPFPVPEVLNPIHELKLGEPLPELLMRHRLRRLLRLAAIGRAGGQLSSNQLESLSSQKEESNRLDLPFRARRAFFCSRLRRCRSFSWSCFRRFFKTPDHSRRHAGRRTKPNRRS